jgi:nicotinamidase-related amidase
VSRTPDRPGADGGALLVLDLMDDFDHPGGGALLAAARERADALRAALADARRARRHVIYVNDDGGAWDGDAPAVVRRALAGPGGDLVAPLAPRPGDRFILKPSYSAFEATPLGILLAELGVGRVALIGAVTEMCVRESAIDAARRNLATVVVGPACVPLDPALGDLALEALERLTGVSVIDALPGGRSGGSGAAAGD